MAISIKDLLAKLEARYGDAAMGYDPPVGPEFIRFSGKLPSAKKMEAGRYGYQKLRRMNELRDRDRS